MGIHLENGKLDMDEIKGMLKKLCTILMLDGMKDVDTEKITLANSLGIILATLDLGPKYYIDLIKSLGPQSKVIADEIDKGNPRLGDLHAVASKTIFTEEGGVNREALKDVLLNVISSKNEESNIDSDDGFVFEAKSVNINRDDLDSFMNSRINPTD